MMEARKIIEFRVNVDYNLPTSSLIDLLEIKQFWPDIFDFRKLTRKNLILGSRIRTLGLFSFYDFVQSDDVRDFMKNRAWCPANGQELLCFMVNIACLDPRAPIVAIGAYQKETQQGIDIEADLIYESGELRVQYSNGVFGKSVLFLGVFDYS